MLKFLDKFRMLKSYLAKKKKDLGNRKHGVQIAKIPPEQWKKNSILFYLPYWKDNYLCHYLDIMHIEKNVFDNVIYTFQNDSTKWKDHVNARKDFQVLGIRPDVWPNENGRYSPTIFTLDSKGNRTFLTTLKNIIVSDGYSSNISWCIDSENLKLTGTLKSHNCHILVWQLLPLAMWSTLSDEVSTVLIELCSFFKKICG